MLWKQKQAQTGSALQRRAVRSAKGVMKGRAEAYATKLGEPVGLLLRLSLQARYRLLNHYVNCILNLKVGFSQPVNQLWKQLTMPLCFLPCDFLANVLFLLSLDTLTTSSAHPSEDLSHSLSSFVWEFCNVLSLSRPPFFPHSAFHLCIILCRNTIQVSSLCRWFIGSWYFYLNENVVLLLCHLLLYYLD